MSFAFIGVAGLVLTLGLLVLGVPIAFATALVGIVGTAIVAGVPKALSALALDAWDNATSLGMACIVLLVFMGQLVAATGIASDLYRLLQRQLVGVRGGLGIASVLACGGVGTMSGSSVACVAAAGTSAYPQMRANGYDAGLATGVLAASGTLGVLVPPSLAFAYYGTITETSIAALFIAGIVPGLVMTLVFAVVAWLQCLRHPELGPPAPRYASQDRFAFARTVPPIALIFVVVMGTMVVGLCTPTEALGIGAITMVLVAALMWHLTWAKLRKALWETGLVCAAVFPVILGGYLLGRFVLLTQVPDLLVDALGRSASSKYAFLVLVIALYAILGCIVDAFGVIVLTLPLVVPMASALGFDAVWLGVFIAMMAQVALVAPQAGVSLVTVRRIATDVPVSRIVRGVAPFMAGELAVIAILVAFPVMATWLPGLLR